MFKSEIDAYRRRRQSGTRLPLDFMYSSKSYLFDLFVAAVLPVGAGVDLIFRHDAAWQRILGSLLWTFVAVEIGLFIRWRRRPVDQEAFDERNRLRDGWMFEPNEKIPPRSEW